jgi:hypothetical protein
MSYKYIVYKMVMEQVYIEIHGMEERNLALGLNIFLSPSKIGLSHIWPNPKHVRIFTCCHFYFAQKYLMCQSFACIAHNEEDPLGSLS